MFLVQEPNSRMTTKKLFFRMQSRQSQQITVALQLTHSVIRRWLAAGPVRAPVSARSCVQTVPPRSSFAKIVQGAPHFHHLRSLLLRCRVCTADTSTGPAFRGPDARCAAVVLRVGLRRVTAHGKQITHLCIHNHDRHKCSASEKGPTATNATACRLNPNAARFVEGLSLACADASAGAWAT